MSARTAGRGTRRWARTSPSTRSGSSSARRWPRGASTARHAAVCECDVGRFAHRFLVLAYRNAGFTVCQPWGLRDHAALASPCVPGVATGSTLGPCRCTEAPRRGSHYVMGRSRMPAGHGAVEGLTRDGASWAAVGLSSVRHCQAGPRPASPIGAPPPLGRDHLAEAAQAIACRRRRFAMRAAGSGTWLQALAVGSRWSTRTSRGAPSASVAGAFSQRSPAFKWRPLHATAGRAYPESMRLAHTWVAAMADGCSGQSEAGRLRTHHSLYITRKASQSPPPPLKQLVEYPPPHPNTK